MNHISQKDLQWRHGKSPKGKYESKRLDYGSAMNACESGHPFEMMLLRIPPGQRPWPYHLHGSQWEFYYVMEGEGEMRLENETVPSRHM